MFLSFLLSSVIFFYQIVTTNLFRDGKIMDTFDK
jgi:hypothetical protein